MTEPTKTLLFLGAACVAVLLAIFTEPDTGAYDPSDQIGQDIARAIELDEAKRLSITEFDEATATIRNFEVAEERGVWTLPSKGGYPADAQRQLAEAIAGVTDREILEVAAEDAGAHGQYGVIDPTSKSLKPGQTGVGVRVTLGGEEEDLVDLIIGKEVKDEQDQRYVRRAGEDVVFVVEIDRGKFSTDFADWIEDDLLKIDSWDLRRVRINDYSSDQFIDPLRGGLVANTTYRSEMTLAYDDENSDWSLESLRVAADPKRPDYQPAEMAANEELNEDALRGLKDALDDLRIVDVNRKPEGLSADLKAGGDFLTNNAAILSLVRRGFAPKEGADGRLELLCSEGEVIATMADGVEYVLRFGNLELDDTESGGQEKDDGGLEKDGDTGGDADEAQGDQNRGVNRYLFVRARFNESAVQRPELREVPPLPEGAANGDAPEEEQPNGEDQGAGEDQGSDGATGSGAGDAAEETESGTRVVDAGEDDGPSDAEAKTELERIVAERKETERSNARLLDEYEEKLKKGRKRVEELNARFGDWYYVVSNATFEKLRVGRDDVIKTKDPSQDNGDDASAPGGDQAGADQAGQSTFGAPGGGVPGLPSLERALNRGVDDSDAETEDEANPDVEDGGGEKGGDPVDPVQPDASNPVAAGDGEDDTDGVQPDGATPGVGDGPLPPPAER